MSTSTLSPEALIERSPYLSWLGIEILACEPDRMEAKATWRPEWVANPKIGQTQGGILAALIDFAADFALYHNLGRLVPTIDMRVDYHRMAVKGDLYVVGKVIRQGRQFSVCEATIYDESKKMIASGRGTYYTAPVE